MVRKSFIVAVKESANKHADNPIIQALVKGVETAQYAIHLSTDAVAGKIPLAGEYTSENVNYDVSPFAGYRRAAQGDRDYSLMINPEKNILDSMIKEMHMHTELAIRVDCLMSALMALGERIEDY